MAATVRYVVVAHSSRFDMAVDLGYQLDADISVDTGDMGSNVNHDVAWRMAYRGKEEWSAVVEDDVDLIPNFHKHVQGALNHIPSPGILSLYAGYPRPAKDRVKKAIDTALTEGKSFIRHNSLLWGLAVIMPSRLVPSMLDLVSRANHLEYDQRFTYWTTRKRIPVYYTVPSLVEHRDEPSLIWNDRPPRKAWVFGQPESWNSDYVNM
jgi:hypothetical protein